MKRAVVLLLGVLSGVASADMSSIEFSDFSNPKRVGIDPFVLGYDNLIVGFDLTPSGAFIPSGTTIDTTFASVGVTLSAVVTVGPHAGETTHTQALDFSVAPDGDGTQVAISPPNILSAVDPVRGPTWSGEVAGTATLRVNFVTPSGQPGFVYSVGAFNDLLFGQNILAAWSEPDGTGTLLGQVDATGPWDFMGLRSTEPIASVTFRGYSTEIDDLVFSPVAVPLPGAALLGAVGLSVAGWRLRRTAS
jgi:hypothetical protein